MKKHPAAVRSRPELESMDFQGSVIIQVKNDKACTWAVTEEKRLQMQRQNL